MKIVKVRKADRYRSVTAKSVELESNRKLVFANPGPAMTLVRVRAKDAARLEISYPGLATFYSKSSLPGISYRSRIFYFGTEDGEKKRYKQQLREFNQDGPYLVANRGFITISLREMEDIQRNGEKSTVFQDKSNDKRRDFLIQNANKIVAELKNMKMEILQKIDKEYEAYQRSHSVKEANRPGKYENFEGAISYNGIQAEVDATFELKPNGNIIWETGVWKSGTWPGGIWKKGYFRNGVWKSGTFEDGDFSAKNDWLGGVFKNGHFSGNFKGGTFEGGTFYAGNWENGKWKNGEWVDGKINGKKSEFPPK